MKKLTLALTLLSGICFGFDQVEVENILEDANAKAGVYAYLTAPSNTTCAATGSWYQVQGVFSNSVIDGFTVSTSNIVCQCLYTNWFEVDWHCSVQGNSASVTPHVTIKVNDTVYEAQMMGTLCKTAGEAYAMSGTVVLPLTSNDTVQLVCSSDGAEDVLTFNHFVTSICKFFITRD